MRANWTPPEGPLPAGDGGDATLVPREGESLDMLSGEWRIFQRKDGHRFSTDDLLCAWLASARAEERGVRVDRAIDLGAGIGSIALMVAWKFPGARVVGVEAQDVSAELFARSIRWDGAVDRVSVRRGDLRDPELAIEAAAYDLVTGSPPYFDEREGVVSDRPQRGPCRFEQRGGVEAYARAGARALAPHGVFTIVHTWAARDRVARAAEERASRAGVDHAGRVPRRPRAAPRPLRALAPGGALRRSDPARHGRRPRTRRRAHGGLLGDARVTRVPAVAQCGQRFPCEHVCTLDSLSIGFPQCWVRRSCKQSCSLP